MSDEDQEDLEAAQWAAYDLERQRFRQECDEFHEQFQRKLKEIERATRQ